MQISITEAKAKLSPLIAAVGRGEEVIITRRAKSVARLVVIAAMSPTFKAALEGEVVGDHQRFPTPCRKVWERQGLVAQINFNSERAFPETAFRRCVQNVGGQVRSSG